MSSRDPVIRAHQEWLGFLQPSGLVVSPPVLAAAGAQVNRNIAPEQMKLKGVAELPDRTCAITDFPSFVQDFLGWAPTDLAGAPGGPELPRSLDVALSHYGEVLSPTYAVPDTGSPTGWLLLIVQLPVGADLDSPSASHATGWNASAQARLERLLRENDIPIGLLSNGAHLRLGQLGFVIPSILREEFWCRLEGEGCFLHFGHDYYMYVGVPVPCPESQKLASRLGLFVEEFASPYHPEEGE